MADFVSVMQRAVLDRPVVDQTRLEGRYNFALNWTPDETQFASLGGVPPGIGRKPDAPPNLFTAIQQQVGLKLDTTKALMDVMVIDKVEKAVRELAISRRRNCRRTERPRRMNRSCARHHAVYRPMDPRTD
ncbi:MAG: TIGR03435 family protein [Bryobacteraceae bacterium]